MGNEERIWFVLTTDLLIYLFLSPRLNLISLSSSSCTRVSPPFFFLNNSLLCTLFLDPIKKMKDMVVLTGETEMGQGERGSSKRIPLSAWLDGVCCFDLIELVPAITLSLSVSDS